MDVFGKMLGLMKLDRELRKMKDISHENGFWQIYDYVDDNFAEPLETLYLNNKRYKKIGLPLLIISILINIGLISVLFA